MPHTFFWDSNIQSSTPTGNQEVYSKLFRLHQIRVRSIWLLHLITLEHTTKHSSYDANQNHKSMKLLWGGGGSISEALREGVNVVSASGGRRKAKPSVQGYLLSSSLPVMPHLDKSDFVAVLSTYSWCCWENHGWYRD